jgi:long-chain fatty acid transport protein
VGVHYRSGMKHHIKGTADTSGFVGPLAAYNGITDARADLKLPAIATAGARIRLSPSLVGLGEFAWYDWSTFDEVRVRLANGLPDVVRPSHYKDAYGVSVGLEYREGPAPLTWRGGVHYDTTPTVDAYRDVTVPDANRLWLGIGATWRPAASFELDVAFTHVFFRDTTINVTRDFGYAVANVRGDVSTSVETLAFDLRWRF